MKNKLYRIVDQKESTYSGEIEISAASFEEAQHLVQTLIDVGEIKFQHCTEEPTQIMGIEERI